MNSFSPIEGLHRVLKYYEKNIVGIAEEYNINLMELHIITFLHNNKQYTTAKDIVNICSFAKSHVSVSLDSLEKKGYIVKKVSKEDKRIISLSLTSATEKLIVEICARQKIFRKKIFEKVSEREAEIFIKVMEQIVETSTQNSDGSVKIENIGAIKNESK